MVYSTVIIFKEGGVKSNFETEIINGNEGRGFGGVMNSFPDFSEV